MSVNKKMHPRNIFKTPPSFSELGQKYPDFNHYLKIGLDGKLSLNFNDVDSLRALSKVLLLHYFGIQIEIPKDTLVPTIPLRLNYILWLQDLANFLQISDNNITVIDVGAGATCVYGLLAAKLRKWKVLALESNYESFLAAKHNVNTNLMTAYIEVKQNENCNGELLIGSLNSNNNYTFSMCNPPFFKEGDLGNGESIKVKCRPPNNAFTGTLNELAFPGGEVAFVEKLIAESKILKDKIHVYTTMVGHKKNLKILLRSLKTTEIHSFIQTEFCQGRTTRWALAWTFKNINLQEFHLNTTKLNNKSSCSKIQSMSHTFTNIHCLQDFLLRLDTVLLEMKMIYKLLYSNENFAEFKVQAIEYTWRNARRKRRELARKENLLKSVENTLSFVNIYLETDYEEQIKNIISNNTNSSNLNDNMTKLKNILNKINEIQINIQKNLIDINENLFKIENKDELLVDKILRCENLFTDKKMKLKLFLDTILTNTNTLIDDHFDITTSFLELLSNASSNNGNKRIADDTADIEVNRKKLKIDLIEEFDRNQNRNNIDSNVSLHHRFIIEFTILSRKMPDEEGIKISFYKTKNNDNSNVLCEIYNFIVNKLRK